jgi:zinc transport system permease protein
MMDFFQILSDPDGGPLRQAVWAGLLASISFGIVGTYVVTRRISYVAGAISHSVLGGIGIALYLQIAMGFAFCTPFRGALIAALLSAFLIGWVSMKGGEREDTVVGAMWSIGMAVGVLFIAKTPGYVDAMSYLFGNILLLRKEDILIVGMLGAAIVAVVVIFYNKLAAVCFDEEFCRVRGLHVGLYYYLLLCLIALVVVVLIRVVGILLVIALLTLPAALAGLFARRLWQMMVLSIIFCAAFTFCGIGISFVYDLPSGPSIVTLAGTVYVVSLSVRNLLPGGRLCRNRVENKIE